MKPFYGVKNAPLTRYFPPDLSKAKKTSPIFAPANSPIVRPNQNIQKSPKKHIRRQKTSWQKTEATHIIYV